jgi:monofunctional glycosyltransferase
MAVAKARSAGRVLLVAGAAGVVFVVWLFAVWPPPIWWRDHEPRCTAMMRLRADVQSCRREGGASARRQENAPLLQRMVIIAEDSRFKTHHGIDFIELREAWAAGGHRGASTITQQLAKNLYLSPSKNPLRKLRELVIARRLEAELKKARILEIYLNVIEWGDGVYGADAAARTYFGVTAAGLGPMDSALLAASIVNPRLLNPARPSSRLLRRQQLILRRMGAVTPPETSAQLER